MRTSRTVSVEKVVVVCDVCGNSQPYFPQCTICGKDVCPDCRTFDDRDWGDYPDQYCRPCWGIGEKFRVTMEDNIQDCDENNNGLNDEWRAAALALAEKSKDNTNEPTD